MCEQTLVSSTIWRLWRTVHTQPVPIYWFCRRLSALVTTHCLRLCTAYCRRNLRNLPTMPFLKILSYGIKSRVTGARNRINLFSMHIRATHIATFPTVCRSMGCCSLLCGALNGIVIEWLFFVMALCHNREIRRINGDPINTP